MEKNYARVIVYKLNYKDYRKCGAIVSQNSFYLFQLKPENFVTFAKVWKRAKQAGAELCQAQGGGWINWN